MPFTTNPTFADSTAPDAADMNILRDNINYVDGLMSENNIGINSHVFTSAGDLGGQMLWGRHNRHRWLHYQISVDAGASFSNNLSILINNSTAAIIAGTPTGPLTFTGVIDLTAESVSVGDWYDIKFAGNKSGGGNATCHYLLESPNETDFTEP